MADRENGAKIVDIRIHVRQSVETPMVAKADIWRVILDVFLRMNFVMQRVETTNILMYTPSGNYMHQVPNAQVSDGSLSSVSTPIFATKYLFFRIFRDLRV